MAKRFKTWDTYVKEAKRPPWVMPYGEGKKIVVENPTGGAMLDIAKMQSDGTADVEQMLRLIAGDAADDLLALLRTGPGEAMNAIMADIMQHFGYATEMPIIPVEDGSEGKAESSRT